MDEITRDERREALGMPPRALGALIEDARAGAIAADTLRRKLREDPDVPGYAFDLCRQLTGLHHIIGQALEHLAAACPAYVEHDEADQPGPRP
jgi:hypothetical protein